MQSTKCHDFDDTGGWGFTDGGGSTDGAWGTLSGWGAPNTPPWGAQSVPNETLPELTMAQAQVTGQAVISTAIDTTCSPRPVAEFSINACSAPADVSAHESTGGAKWRDISDTPFGQQTSETSDAPLQELTHPLVSNDATPSRCDENPAPIQPQHGPIPNVPQPELLSFPFGSAPVSFTAAEIAKEWRSFIRTLHEAIMAQASHITVQQELDKFRATQRSKIYSRAGHAAQQILDNRRNELNSAVSASQKTMDNLVANIMRMKVPIGSNCAAEFDTASLVSHLKVYMLQIGSWINIVNSRIHHHSSDLAIPTLARRVDDFHIHEESSESESRPVKRRRTQESSDTHIQADLDRLESAMESTETRIQSLAALPISAIVQEKFPDKLAELSKIILPSANAGHSDLQKQIDQVNLKGSQIRNDLSLLRAEVDLLRKERLLDSQATVKLQNENAQMRSHLVKQNSITWQPEDHQVHQSTLLSLQECRNTIGPLIGTDHPRDVEAPGEFSQYPNDGDKDVAKLLVPQCVSSIRTDVELVERKIYAHVESGMKAQNARIWKEMWTMLEPIRKVTVTVRQAVPDSSSQAVH